MASELDKARAKPIYLSSTMEKDYNEREERPQANNAVGGYRCLGTKNVASIHIAMATWCWLTSTSPQLTPRAIVRLQAHYV